MTDRFGEEDKNAFKAMPGSTRAQRDAEIFNVLSRRGADLSKPRHALFYLYFPTKEAAEMARAELMKSSLAKEKSFKVEVEPGASDSNWLCRAEAEMVIDPEVMDRLRPSLETIARQGNGEYDGWECAAEP